MHERLAHSTRELLSMVSHASLNRIILTTHLGDLLAALIQLSYAPLKKPLESEQNIEDDTSEFVMTQDKYKELSNEQDQFKQELQKMLGLILGGNRTEHSQHCL